jgi:hypothetical protein
MKGGPKCAQCAGNGSQRLLGAGPHFRLVLQDGRPSRFVMSEQVRDVPGNLKIQPNDVWSCACG